MTHIKHKALYQRLSETQPESGARAQAADFLRSELQSLERQPIDLPESPKDLHLWMAQEHRQVHQEYGSYLTQRKQGATRRFFSNRAHALFFLRAAAPTKLVDGAWLYGLLPHWRNPRYSDLVRTYIEELGEGAPDKNHVTLYHALLARHGLAPLHDLPDRLYHQGLVQLALGWSADDFLPEIVGFNLAYEQLPLHLLITAYELDELGIDPYYFTLHVTVDNGDTGHARRACQAAHDSLPRLADGGACWARMRRGSRLANAGTSTTRIIEDFDIEAEALRILAHKAGSGAGAHSDYCRVAGRSINEWLSAPELMPGFVGALEHAGWIRRGEPAALSRFWRLLQGERAEMFGVFSGYELQVIHDWIRGAASADGAPYARGESTTAITRTPSFRASQRLSRRNTAIQPLGEVEPMDEDCALMHGLLRSADEPKTTRSLIQAMSPALHWTPVGLLATRAFCQSGR